ncbi:ethylbenzene dehydrogenase-related protein [Motilimonas eburnea]|uniref:ethylbenzene dehydrogenase-related protein n=1 Tax=Motilimonas eburnea TaxID=1737488 RepID=UPI001E4AB419|nr:ethylbenzene dehydrogenase-related protein [Motilimonas eburnea]MCE2573258.1 hypothetical protein [Motilimonas eburnea]
MRMRSTDWPLVIIHSTAMVALVISLLSGFRLAQDSQHAVAVVQRLQWLLPQGDVFFWHGLSALIWIGVMLAYAGYLLLRDKPLAAVKSKRLLIQSLKVVLPLSLVTGLLLYFSPQSLSFLWLLEIHYYLAIMVVLLASLHILLQLQSGIKPTLAIFLFRRAPAKHSLPLCIGVLVAGLCFFYYPSLTPKLVSQHTAQPVRIDGISDEWTQITESYLWLGQGANQGQQLRVSARSMHDEHVVYFLFRWQDTEPSYQHLPLIKTAQGWQVRQQGFATDDEQQFYEDKFAVMLSHSARFGAAGSIHLGAKPRADLPESRSGRGYHYLKQGLVDVWQWKAARLSHMSVLDDDHFAQPVKVCDYCPRYTAGYQTDAKDAGGYRMNWQWFDANTVVPLRLPKAEFMAQFLPSSGSELGADLSQYAISWWDTQAYSEHLDTYPIGTALPSVLLLDQFEGDRGDVRAVATWQDGFWQLEIARNRQTHSEHDLNIESGIYIWPASFDANQTRHSYSQQPWQLVLEQQG